MRQRYIKADWTVGVAGDMSKGALAATQVGPWIHVGSRRFSVQHVWTAANSPLGALTMETSNNGGVTADSIDDTLLFPVVVNPDGTTTPNHQTRDYDLSVNQIRFTYTRTSGGALPDQVESFITIKAT